MIALSKLFFTTGVVTTIALANANKNLRSRQLVEKYDARQLRNHMNLNGRRLVTTIFIFIYQFLYLFVNVSL